MNPLPILGQRENARYRARLASDPRVPRNTITDVPQAVVDYYAISIGARHEDANRYSDICPYDRNQVCAHRYLNASWILERYGGKWWIASQAPVESSFHAFLSLLMNPVTPPVGNQSPTWLRTVVQLTRYTEGMTVKAHPYFPSRVGESFTVYPESTYQAAPLRITLDHVCFVKEASCLKSVVSVHAQGREPYTFHHLLYDAWPDHAVPSPENRHSLLTFLKLAESTNKSLSPDDPPIVVGCSAGVGRTGTFIALASLLRAHGLLASPKKPTPYTALPPSPLGSIHHADQVVEEIDFLREQRTSMVQRNEQVMLIYEMLRSVLSSPST